MGILIEEGPVAVLGHRKQPQGFVSKAPEATIVNPSGARQRDNRESSPQNAVFGGGRTASGLHAAGREREFETAGERTRRRKSLQELALERRKADARRHRPFV